jgi:hypothetical protein
MRGVEVTAGAAYTDGTTGITRVTTHVSIGAIFVMTGAMFVAISVRSDDWTVATFGANLERTGAISGLARFGKTVNSCGKNDKVVRSGNLTAWAANRAERSEQDRVIVEATVAVDLAVAVKCAAAAIQQRSGAVVAAAAVVKGAAVAVVAEAETAAAVAATVK